MRFGVRARGRGRGRVIRARLLRQLGREVGIVGLDLLGLLRRLQVLREGRGGWVWVYEGAGVCEGVCEGV